MISFNPNYDSSRNQAQVGVFKKHSDVEIIFSLRKV